MSESETTTKCFKLESDSKNCWKKSPIRSGKVEQKEGIKKHYVTLRQTTKLLEKFFFFTPNPNCYHRNLLTRAEY